MRVCQGSGCGVRGARSLRQPASAGLHVKDVGLCCTGGPGFNARGHGQACSGAPSVGAPAAPARVAGIGQRAQGSAARALCQRPARRKTKARGLLCKPWCVQSGSAGSSCAHGVAQLLLAFQTQRRARHTAWHASRGLGRAHSGDEPRAGCRTEHWMSASCCSLQLLPAVHRDGVHGCKRNRGRTYRWCAFSWP